MEISIQTKMITLIGTPLSQSFAARMQNAGYAAGNIDLCYFYTETGSEHLGEIVQGLRHMPSFRGFAVTKPNKVEVLKYLDELDPLCAKMGASNTVLRTDDGRLIGYNTDGIGFSMSMEKDAKVNLKGITAFCLGAGGAGRAICSSMAYDGAKKIYITDLFEESGRSLCDDINKNFAPIAEFVPYQNFEKIAECELIINATGIGMGSSIGTSPLPEMYIKPEQIYFDACYNPDKTQFLLNAEKHGCRIYNGLNMSIYQGCRQIEIWTGKEAPVEAMREEILKILKEKEMEN